MRILENMVPGGGKKRERVMQGRVNCTTEEKKGQHARHETQ